MSIGESRIPQPDIKRDVFEELLKKGVAALHIDARRPGVEVPNDLRDHSCLVLNYSYRYHIEDFKVDDSHVIASLSFAGSPFPCRVPWDAVFAISDARREEVRLWPEDVPLELRVVPTGDSGGRELTAPVVRAPKEETHVSALRVISGAGTATATPKRGHLRRVK